MTQHWSTSLPPPRSPLVHDCIWQPTLHPCSADISVQLLSDFFFLFEKFDEVWGVDPLNLLIQVTVKKSINSNYEKNIPLINQRILSLTSVLNGSFFLPFTKFSSYKQMQLIKSFHFNSWIFEKPPLIFFQPHEETMALSKSLKRWRYSKALIVDGIHSVFSVVFFNF